MRHVITGSVYASGGGGARAAGVGSRMGDLSGTDPDSINAYISLHESQNMEWDAEALGTLMWLCVRTQVCT